MEEKEIKNVSRGTKQSTKIVVIEIKVGPISDLVYKRFNTKKEKDLYFEGMNEILKTLKSENIEASVDSREVEV